MPIAIVSTSREESISNYSADSADIPIFIASHHVRPGDGPIGGSFFRRGCLSTCHSVISQDDADDCAQRQAVLCAGSDGSGGGGGGPIFTNEAQSCTILCPDGSTFTITIPAGTAPGIDPGAGIYSPFPSATPADPDQSRPILEVSSPWPTQLPPAGMGFPYNARLGNDTGFYGAFSLVAGALPSGLVIANTTVAAIVSSFIQGTPTVSGRFIITVRVPFDTLTPTGRVGFLRMTLNLRVLNIANGFVSLGEVTSPSRLPDARPLTVYDDPETTDTFTDPAINDGADTPGVRLIPEGTLGGVSWGLEDGVLPAGLSLHPTKGFIYGTNQALAAGTYDFTVRLQDTGTGIPFGNPLPGSFTKPFRIVVTGHTIDITTALPSGNVQAQYVAGIQLEASDTIGTVLWTVSHGELPPGLSLNLTTGVISGTPTATGSWTFTIQAQDRGGDGSLGSASATKEFTVSLTTP